MSQLSNNVLLIGSLIALSACSGGGNSGGDVVAEQSALFLGSTDPVASRSGLDYADGTQTLDDLVGQTHIVRLVRTVTDVATGETTRNISDETLTINAVGDADNFTLTLDGETLNFVDKDAERSDGTSIRGFDLAFFNSFDDLEFVNVIRLIDNENTEGGRENEVTSAHFVTGFATSPDAPALTTGFATYAGIVEGFSRDRGLDGTFVLNADFANGQIDGQVKMDEFEVAFGSGNATFDLSTTAITGNGFVGDLTTVDCSFESCVSESEMSGVFFGPNAEEVAGVVLFDVTVANEDGDIDKVNSTAGFGATGVLN